LIDNNNLYIYYQIYINFEFENDDDIQNASRHE